MLINICRSCNNTVTVVDHSPVFTWSAVNNDRKICLWKVSFLLHFSFDLSKPQMKIRLFHWVALYDFFYVKNIFLLVGGKKCSWIQDLSFVSTLIWNCKYWDHFKGLLLFVCLRSRKTGFVIWITTFYSKGSSRHPLSSLLFHSPKLQVCKISNGDYICFGLDIEYYVKKPFVCNYWYF